jgi:hypothetical protein
MSQATDFFEMQRRFADGARKAGQESELHHDIRCRSVKSYFSVTYGRAYEFLDGSVLRVTRSVSAGHGLYLAVLDDAQIADMRNMNVLGRNGQL